eukprot:m.79110 g.79110  ORF g.79110 m.79110 type:complete len:70 (-) comp17402_c1_seq3:365-574(-)
MCRQERSHGPCTTAGETKEQTANQQWTVLTSGRHHDNCLHFSRILKWTAAPSREFPYSVPFTERTPAKD